MGLTLFWCCCNVKKVQHVPLLCTGSGWWGKEMGKEVIYIMNKSHFSIFSPCYCLKSTALFIAVWHVFPQCHFKKGKNKYRNFFVVKIVTQWNHTSSFSSSWWNLKPTRHRFLNLNYACQRLMQSQQNAVQKMCSDGWESQGREGRGTNYDIPWSVDGLASDQIIAPWRKRNLNYIHREAQSITVLCLRCSFCLSVSLCCLSVGKVSLSVLQPTPQFKYIHYYALVVSMTVLRFS